MLSRKQDSSSPTGNEVFLRTKVVVVHMMFNPPGMMSRHKHGQGRECKQPAVWFCFFKNKVMIALVCKLKQIDVNP